MSKKNEKLSTKTMDIVIKAKQLFPILKRRFPGLDTQQKSEAPYVSLAGICSHSDVDYLSLYSILYNELIYYMNDPVLTNLTSEENKSLNSIIDKFLLDNKRIIDREYNEPV